MIGFFKGKVIPFTATDLSQPLSLSIGAMVNDGQPADWNGPDAKVSVRIQGDNSSFRLLSLFDSSMNLLPRFETTPFVGGGWEGFFKILRINTVNNDFGLEFHSLDPAEPNVGGASNVVTVNDAPPPPARSIVSTTVVFTDDTSENSAATPERGIRRVRVRFSDGTKTDIV